jgi:hypothetical protein
MLLSPPRKCFAEIQLLSTSRYCIVRRLASWARSQWNCPGTQRDNFPIGVADQPQPIGASRIWRNYLHVAKKHGDFAGSPFP